MRVPVILIFDIGKTNKKALLFDEGYHLVYEASRPLPESTDEDGFPCENLQALTSWIKQTLKRLASLPQFDIKAINFTAYGASLVYLDNDQKARLPLYNYLKPYPPALQRKFFRHHGSPALLTKQTASPLLGSLNSGLQLYRIKSQKPESFAGIQWALHLPQYLSWLLSSSLHNEITGLGCHTLLWDFRKLDYHAWVKSERLEQLFPRLLPSNAIAGSTVGGIPVGGGLHDSSAALIPYLSSFREPFILLSTGTWSISLNPFNKKPITSGELRNDCLCYLSYEGTPVKASRLFAGYEHEQALKKLATYFRKPLTYYQSVSFDGQLIKRRRKETPATPKLGAKSIWVSSGFARRQMHSFENYEQAYHQLIADIMVQQVRSTKLVMKGSPVKRIFVDGGFSSNPVFMNLLARSFPKIEIFAATIPQASALGAALAIHHHWNKNPLPSALVELKHYSS